MGRPKKIQTEAAEEYFPNENEETMRPEDILGDFLKRKPSEHLNSVEESTYKISTGSLILDIATGGGLGAGVHRLVGQNNCGKTPEMLEIISNFIKTIPKNRRGLIIDAEGKLSKENKERTDLKFIYNPKDWKDGTVFVLVSNIYEMVSQLIEALIRIETDNETKYCIGIDSNDALILKSDLDKSLEENTRMAGGPLLMKRFLSRNSIHITRRGHLCIVVSQVSADIQADKYKQSSNAGNNFTGGNALLHFPSFIIEYNNELGKGKYILDDPNGRLNDGKSKQIGYKCKVTIRKTTQENKDSQYWYPIKYRRKHGSGIWREREVGQLLIAYQFLKREGKQGSFSFEPNFAKELKNSGFDSEQKIRSENAIYELLEGNEKLTNFCFNKLKEVLADEELGEKEVKDDEKETSNEMAE